MSVPIYLRDALYKKDLLPAWIQGVVSLCAVQSITIHEHEKGPRVCVGGWVVGMEFKDSGFMHTLCPKWLVLLYTLMKTLNYSICTKTSKLACTLTCMTIYILTTVSMIL